MNDQPTLTPPDMPDAQDAQMEKWEIAVQDRARQFAYPPTPDIAGSVRARLVTPARSGVGRGLRVAAMVLLALAIATRAVPQTRAFVLDMLRIGAVRIFFGEPTITLTPTITETPAASGANGTPNPTRTPRPTAIPPYTPVASALDLPGETTLADAERQLGSSILLPAYPVTLDAPDHVYAQVIGRGVVVTLVWMKPDDPAQIDLVLQTLNAETVASKYFPWEAGNQQEVQVNGRRAYWLTGVHRLYFYETEGDISRVIDKNVLVWEVGEMTYRLETDQSLDEAIRMAESLR